MGLDKGKGLSSVLGAVGPTPLPNLRRMRVATAGLRNAARGMRQAWLVAGMALVFCIADPAPHDSQHFVTGAGGASEGEGQAESWVLRL